MDLARYNSIKELIKFNLDATLRNLKINEISFGQEGDPEIIQIEGQYGFGKRYNLDYQYEKLTELYDNGELTKHLLGVRETIIKEG